MKQIIFDYLCDLANDPDCSSSLTDDNAMACFYEYII